LGSLRPPHGPDDDQLGIYLSDPALVLSIKTPLNTYTNAVVEVLQDPVQL